MKPLYVCLAEKKGNAAASVIKHLYASGIKDWGDLTKSGLYEFRDEVLKTLAPSSARTVFAVFRSFLNRYTDDVEFCKEYADILVSKDERAIHTYLNQIELSKLEHVETRSKKEEMVKIQALISAFTGLRVSDIERVSLENIENNFLTYKSLKTGTIATIPVSEKTIGWIRYAQEHKEDEPTLAARDRALKRLCEKAGINKKVKIYRGGKELVGPKYEFISSHSMRRSFVTNLTAAGVAIADTARMAGHGTNIGTTQRYICDYKINIPARAMEYLGVTKGEE